VSFDLRDYQTSFVTSIRAAFSAGKRRVLAVSPTGSGKTVMFVYIARGAAARGKRICILVHRQELLDQTSRALDEMGVEHGVIAGGRTGRKGAVQVASVQTLVRRLDQYPGFDMIVVDEAHHAAAGSWEKIMAAYPNAFVLGVTATPERLDGRGLGNHFSEIIVGPTVAELIEQGYLSPYRLYAPTRPDLAEVQTRMGDYVAAELVAAMDKPTITGDAVDHYRRLAAGKRALVFCVSIKHSEHVAAQFGGAGFSFLHIDGNTDPGTRMAGTRAFAKEQVQGLSNVDLFGEGYDVPGAEVAILLRPTQSLGLFLQQCGRVLRPVYAPGFDLTTVGGRRAAIAAGPKPYAILLDHAGCCHMHGLPDDVREWSLEGRKKRRKSEASEDGPAIRQCDQCFAVCAATLTACPACGKPFKVVGRPGPEQVDGELVEFRRDPEADRLKAMTYKESLAWAGTDIEKLYKIAKAKKYRRTWAMHVLRGQRRAG
jgi:superfamily II DNA or RNA helicase